MWEIFVYIGIGLGSAGISAVLVALHYTRKKKVLVQRLNQMLDAVMANSFEEHSYDETVLSQIESKMKRFLSSYVIAEHALSRERDQIKMLISDISHQTKTRIANIVLYVQLLQEQGGGESEAQELTNQIALQSEKLNFLIQALIKTSRMETGMIDLTTQHYSVNQLIQHTLTQVVEQAQQKQINLQVHMEGEVEAVFDPKWTEEALFNMLDNSIKYTGAQGTVTISAQSYEMFTRIDISDTGIGMSEQEINRIFQRFYRSPQVNQIEGVGIGLYLSREIISKQQGYIKVKSELKKGSTFSVFLPRKKSSRESFRKERFQKEA